ncbi:hypothetical protein L249_7926 [Ophiocordyceps polyrhachis-furcata BCC 54312]|uniref:Pentatricopeptide repeat protein n=1 Tax=Ophiocordyceps polyrhachis-furcata BCC 54312 TaxID=1330021 RepID=A0A367LHQ7_9HYPO|nr:hypothetical protein L249_7926 [Ophiocordyceps polyrhachis-furcata BCC 54312]
MTAGILRCAACLRKTMAAELSPSSRLALPVGRGRRSYATEAGDIALYDYPAADSAHYVPPKEIVKDQNAVNSLTKTGVARLRRVVNKHLTYMDDPWKIGKYVEATLAKDRFEEALLLTQTVSKDHDVVVSWNHLIGYQMQKQQLTKAIKLFNDSCAYRHFVVYQMKKRGQLPNVTTYSIIFNGCAESDHPKAALAEAFKHYHLLLNCSRLRANTIHLNCMLKLCVKAADIESLFLVAETINDTHRSPDSLTYGTILNALRLDALKRIDGLTPEQVAANRQKAVDRAKSLWVEVLQKWKKGRLAMTEPLVCSMGRILLLDPNSNAKSDVLDLLQTTMNIPNLTKDVDSDPFNDATMLNIAVNDAPTTKTTHAIPGRNALGLVITFLSSTKHTTVGIKYWNLMVRHYGVVPDRDNWYRMLGMIKVARASAHAADMLEMLPDEYVCDKPFRIAMETCVRDNANVNVIRNAAKVLDSMLRRLRLPDLHTLRLYLRVALITHSHFRRQAHETGDEAVAKRSYGLQISAALDRLWEPYKESYHHYFQVASRRHDVPDGIYNSQREVMALVRAMYKAIVKLVDESLLPEAELQELRRRGAKINREIQAFYLERNKIEPNIIKRAGHQHHQQRSPTPHPAGPDQTTLGSRDEDGCEDLAADFSREPHGDDGDDLFTLRGEWEWDTTKALPKTRKATTGVRAPRASPSPSPSSSSSSSSSSRKVASPANPQAKPSRTVKGRESKSPSAPVRHQRSQN